MTPTTPKTIAIGSSVIIALGALTGRCRGRRKEPRKSSLAHGSVRCNTIRRAEYNPAPPVAGRALGRLGLRHGQGAPVADLETIDQEKDDGGLYKA